MATVPQWVLDQQAKSGTAMFPQGQQQQRLGFDYDPSKSANWNRIQQSRWDSPQYDPNRMFDDKQRMFDNLRSNVTRRTAGGALVDESAPTGLDWLEANGPGQQSWEGAGGLQFDPNAVARVQQQQFPGQIIDSDRGRTVQGQYGGGFATQKGATPFPSQQDTQAGDMSGMASTGPFLGAEKARIDANIMNALNYNQSQAPRPAPQVAQGPGDVLSPADDAENYGRSEVPTNAQNVYKPNQGENNFPTSSDKTKRMAAQEMARRQQYKEENMLPADFFSNPESDSSDYVNQQLGAQKGPLKGATSTARRNEAISRYMSQGDPGLMQKVLRGMSLGNRGIIDMLASPFRSGPDREHRSADTFLRSQLSK